MEALLHSLSAQEGLWEVTGYQNQCFRGQPLDTFPCMALLSHTAEVGESISARSRVIAQVEA
jgi:hypothetical protein